MSWTKLLIKLFAISLLSITCVTILFVTSENQLHRNNAFTRRFPHHPITKLYDLQIGYNSYYLVGYHNENLYLGNTTAPLHLLKINLKRQDTSHIRITLERHEDKFRSVTVKFLPPYFFLMDGTTPCIYRGNIGDWKASLWMQGDAYFTNAIPIDSNKLYIKTISSKTNETVLGTIEKSRSFKVHLNDSLLQRQIDGIFDVDGSMVSSQDFQTLGYVYFYRNQFLIMNSNLSSVQREKTIDTVAVANIRLSELNKLGEVKMSAPPLQINAASAIVNNLMMINSDRLGKYEEQSMLDQAATIDVYDWGKHTYEFSFYVYKLNKEKLREFNIYDDYLVALLGSSLSVYKLKPTYFAKYSKQLDLAQAKPK